jgi:hypothetical protein
MEHIHRVRPQLLAEKHCSVRMPGIVLGECEDPKSFSLAAGLQFAAVRANDKLLVAQVTESTSQLEQLVLASPEVTCRVNVGDPQSTRLDH